MHYNTKFAAISLSIAFSSYSYAVEEIQQKRDVYLNGHNIILEEDENITKFITPKKLTDHGRFEIRIKRAEEKVEEDLSATKSDEPTLKDKIEARRIMHLANQAYFKGDLTKVWELVAKAEKLDPNSYRIKTMKGSLLYKIGSVDLAVEVWIESLKQKPNQPEIIKVIEQVRGKPLDRSQFAKGSSNKAKM